MKKVTLDHLKTQSFKNKSYKKRLDKMVEFKDLEKLGKSLRTAGKKIVFTTGSYDLLNPGHCRYLAEAKSCGDILVVGVSTDLSDSILKGPDYPLISEEIRAEMLSFLKTVDYVILTEEYRPHAVLSLLKPHVFFTSAGAWEKGVRDIQEKSIVKSYGGIIKERENKLPHFSTELLVDHIANIRVMQILESYLKEKLSDFVLDPEKNLKPAEYGRQKPNNLKAFDSHKNIIEYSDLKELGDKLRSQKKKVVFVSGSYDLLHVGHARFIEQAGLLGDVLVVGIPSDGSLRHLKGVGRPMISEHARAYVLGHIEPVDFVTIFPDYSVYNCLENLRPDIFFTVSEDWNNGYKSSAEYKLVKKYGGDVVAQERQAPFTSSSAIIDKMAHRKVMEIFKECMNEERYQKVLAEKARLSKSGLSNHLLSKNK